MNGPEEPAEAGSRMNGPEEPVGTIVVRVLTTILEHYYPDDGLVASIWTIPTELRFQLQEDVASLYQRVVKNDNRVVDVEPYLRNYLDL